MNDETKQLKWSNLWKITWDVKFHLLTASDKEAVILAPTGELAAKLACEVECATQEAFKH